MIRRITAHHVVRTGGGAPSPWRSSRWPGNGPRSPPPTRGSATRRART